MGWQVAIRRLVMVAWVLFAALLIVQPEFAHAQTATPFQQNSGAYGTYAASCPTGEPSRFGMVVNCSCYNGVANRVVACIRMTVHEAADNYFTGIYLIFARAIGAFLTIGVIVYGVMLASGQVEKLGRDTMILGIKVAFIVYFVTNADELYWMAVRIMDELANAFLVHAVWPGGSGTGCAMLSTVWNRLDCLLDGVIGITNPNIPADGALKTLTGDALQRGMLAFFFQLMTSSSLTFVIGLMGMIFTYTLVFFVIKTIFAYLVSFLVLVFLLMLTPIFVPLVLFKVTKQFFDKWVRLVMSCILQPVLLIAFISMAISALDVTVFSGPTSFMRIVAGDAAKNGNFNINQYLDACNAAQPDNLCQQKSLKQAAEIKGEDAHADLIRMRDSATSAFTNSESNCLSNFVQAGRIPGAQALRPSATPPPSGAPPSGTNIADCVRGKIIGLTVNTVNLKGVAAYRTPPVPGATLEEKERNLSKELFGSALLAVMMFFLMNALMRLVPAIANDLTGEFRYTPNMYSIGGSGWERGLQGLIR
jgi:hypothetical protein